VRQQASAFLCGTFAAVADSQLVAPELIDALCASRYASAARPLTSKRETPGKPVASAPSQRKSDQTIKRTELQGACRLIGGGR
jgi:hypothetical protein